METQNMKPIHLLAAEIDYELRIRGISTTRKDMAAKRKILARALVVDRNRDIDLVDPNYDFDNEKKVITETLEQISLLVDDFEGDESDSLFKRVRSKLTYISNRIKRIVLPQDETEVADFRNESYATCLELEAILNEKAINFNKANVSNAHNESLPTSHNASLNVSATQVIKKPVPVYKWNLQFSGEITTSLKSFLDRVDELRIARNVDKHELFVCAVDLFCGNALLWFRSIRNEVRDWDSLVVKLKEQFLPPDYEDRLWDEIRTRTQGRKEAVHIYVAVMETLFSRLERPVVEITKLKYIKKNMLPHYVNQLSLTQINSIAELLSYCRRIDEAQVIQQNYHTPSKFSHIEPELAYVYDKPSTSGVNTRPTCATVSASKSENYNSQTISKIVCWNCNGPNHTFRNCSMRRKKFCFKCGKPNETTRTCSYCSGNAVRGCTK